MSSVGENAGVLVELTRLRRLPWSPWPVADLQMEAGRATLPWRGSDGDGPGRYFVEWTVDKRLVWGRDALPAAEREPRILPRADHLLVRGVWTAGGALDVGGSLVAVEISGVPAVGMPDVGGVPAVGVPDVGGVPVAGSWVEVRLDPAAVSVYPYDL
jgi:hypothetical protein